ncbi:MAG: LysM peptidoglycan-binding domain-containing protein [Ignavibacteria bacterium]|nr:LysM peptidoglycan-binding domain-containing protein [Ignavibacteria bacterium]MBT8380890.1 LysM peptidoglycan-binding domain-containing protein [Ignavibacteria bacterium]MBT8391031.1 LysM peptidoglycan-binding domain-containing protein [Ignavibacteria bacterium]NNJ54179.1 LysM peptidoglycan-binding domain-containing protein [Ignavibacteriaceae bacterium]NNL20686.1 LysM peptidoglycan-binding domain-containing protein [Ignavibacteriaceae bacterium]
MKLKNFLVALVSLVFLFSISSFAQEEMTVEEWEAEMTRLTGKKQALMSEMEALNADLDNLNATLAGLQDPEECIDELYALVGATRSDVENFRKAVNELDGKIKRKESPKADRQADLDALKMNKISALPEFFEKVHVKMQAALDDWIDAPPVIAYKVVRGDHLWGIARKKEHYGNGFAWPIIYKANRNKIKNPDLIYPDQVFDIPPLTQEEKDKYERLRRNYKPAPVQ